MVGSRLTPLHRTLPARSLDAELRVSAAIGALASRALMLEPATWPRFGLVGPEDPGGHDDMDYQDLLRSARALEPFFAQSAALGLRLSPWDREAPLQWRHSGLAAEGVMYQATGGVNTHKGAIFLLGLLAFSAGRLLQRASGVALNGRGASMKGEGILDVAFEALAWRLEEEQRAQEGRWSETYGQWAARRFGWGGMRHTVLSDFWPLRRALDLRPGLRNLPRPLALGVVRHHLVVHSEDTNLLRRAGWKNTQGVLAAAQEALALGSCRTPAGLSMLVALDRRVAEERWSVSGAGDLLAAFLFLDTLQSSTLGGRLC